MDKRCEFMYKEKYCIVWYYDCKFKLAVYKDEKYSILENAVDLFPSKRFSENQKSIAFHVAFLHVLPNLIQ